MSWITEQPSDKFEPVTYWIPEEFPECTDEQEKTQLSKKYLRPDGKIVNHPGWFYPNGAKVCDVYLYYNHEWLTIVGEKPDKINIDENVYFFVEEPKENWEKINEEPFYRIEIKYKKYLYVQQNRPEWSYTKKITHRYEYDDENMTVTDGYVIEDIAQEEISKLEKTTTDRLRKIREYILSQTDYLILISREKNINPSIEFLTYRQKLRDLPSTIDLSTLSQKNFNKIFDLYLMVMNNIDFSQFKIELKKTSIVLLPQLPTNFFEE